MLHLYTQKQCIQCFDERQVFIQRADRFKVSSPTLAMVDESKCRPIVSSFSVVALSVWPHGGGLLVAGLFFTDYPPSWEKIPPVEDPGLCDPPGEPGWLSW